MPRTTLTYDVSAPRHHPAVWRALPADFPPAWTVYWWADKWQADGSTARMHDDLRERIRLAAGRSKQPSAAVIDSQSVKGSEIIARPRRGYDAGKKINGTKRHIAVGRGPQAVGQDVPYPGRPGKPALTRSMSSACC